MHRPAKYVFSFVYLSNLSVSLFKILVEKNLNLVSKYYAKNPFEEEETHEFE